MYQAAPLNLSPTMTLLAPRTGRNLTPHSFVVPVVRELPSSLSRLPAFLLLVRLVATSSTNRITAGRLSPPPSGGR